MTRLCAMMSLCTLLMLPTLSGCSRRGNESNSPNAAASDIGPFEELKTIPAAIGDELDVVQRPIYAVDIVIDQLTAIQSKYNIDAATLGSITRTQLSGSQSAGIEVSAEAKAQIETTLANVKGIVSGLERTPENATAAGVNIVQHGVHAMALVAKLQAEYEAKLASPLTAGDQRQRLQGELDIVLKLDAHIKTLVADARSTVKGLPAKGTQALAKITAAFAGSANAGS